ncbi:MAG TPA: NYN domain-containing protein [Phycisphaerae bacterium]|nr:NYN domain-containing protein [Phycisphaerae bacterium]
MRANVYVDGFNLYYGAVRGTAHKWLNLERLFTLLRPHDEIQTIYYFTALIDGSRLPNQMRYLRALETLPRVRTVMGKFKFKRVACNVPQCTYPGSRLFSVPEEKRTDVQIALMMARDAWEGDCERMILVSGDSDLVPAVNLVKEVKPQTEIVVYVPARHQARGAAVELRGAADKDRILPNNLLRHCQFPTALPDGHGGSIRKPQGW